MQVFASSSDPTLCAQWLDDKRVNKMITESAQIICTVLRTDGIKNLPFKSTHEHHPVTKWAGSSGANLWWLLRHHFALHAEWSHRFGKLHASGLSEEQTASVRITKEPQTFLNAAKSTIREVDFTWVEDVHQAYRLYLTARWLRDTLQPKWTKRSAPGWYDLPFVNDDQESLMLINKMRELIGSGFEGSMNCVRCGDKLSYQSRNDFECKGGDYTCLKWQKLKRS
jgi:hypothetical protein